MNTKKMVGWILIALSFLIFILGLNLISSIVSVPTSPLAYIFIIFGILLMIIGVILVTRK